MGVELVSVGCKGRGWLAGIFCSFLLLIFWKGKGEYVEGEKGGGEVQIELITKSLHCFASSGGERFS